MITITYHNIMTLINKSTIVFAFGIVNIASADIIWPLYNQQCRDDAGSPYLDDEPGVKYHDGSGAWPVLLEDGTCANPLKEACELRGDAKTAYLEGKSYLHLFICCNTISMPIRR